MEWGKFLACLFLGGFGVHKFIENKTGWGIAYFLTGGLFGFGWLYDTIGYLLRGIMGERAESADGLPSALAGLAPQKRLIARNVIWMNVSRAVALSVLYWPVCAGHGGDCRTDPQVARDAGSGDQVAVPGPDRIGCAGDESALFADGGVDCADL